MHSNFQFRKLGLLVTSLKSTGEIKRYIDAMKQNNLPFTLYSASEIRNKYPQLKYSDDWEGLFDPEGGILQAEKCLAAFQVILIAIHFFLYILRHFRFF